jgi:hypothetical protein
MVINRIRLAPRSLGAGQHAAVGHRPELSELGRHPDRVDEFDQALGGPAVADEVGDRDDRQLVFGREPRQGLAASHRSVLVDDLPDHADSGDDSAKATEMTRRRCAIRRVGTRRLHGALLKGMLMSDHVYRITDLVGSSPNGVDDAVRNAIARANRTLRNMDWFEVAEVRGHLVDGQVADWQVRVRIGFRLEDGD